MVWGFSNGLSSVAIRRNLFYYNLHCGFSFYQWPFFCGHLKFDQMPRGLGAYLGITRVGIFKGTVFTANDDCGAGKIYAVEI